MNSATRLLTRGALVKPTQFFTPFTPFSRRFITTTQISTNTISATTYTHPRTYTQSISTSSHHITPITPFKPLTSTRTFSTEKPVPAPTGRFTAEEEAQHREIERWGASFDISNIRRNYLDFSFARSSGPGGQNVNKVSSKAQVRFILDDADWIHPSVRKRMKEQHARYISKNMDNRNEFFLQSEVHRTQEANSEECIKKIYEVIKDCCAVPKETSDAQKKKVQKMIEIQKKKDIEAKKRLKEKKADRRGGRD